MLAAEVFRNQRKAAEGEKSEEMSFQVLRELRVKEVVEEEEERKRARKGRTCARR